jgi:hypothetical protein
MLRKLQLHHVGPKGDIGLDPVARRFNLITGDNGLGKSFLLEAAWWSLTRTWHEYPAVPSAPDAFIQHAFDGTSGVSNSKSKWSKKAQEWKRKSGKPANPGLVLYARVDGSFSVWDPARNYRLYTRRDGGRAESPSAYQFTSSEVLWGKTRQVLEAGRTREETLCLGLVDDWREWMRSGDPRFAMLQRLLEHLGPDEQPLVPGELRRPSLDDVRLIPTVRMPYGEDVPITYAPAGVRRMAKLAYLLAWSLSEHESESERIGKGAANQVIVLVDEIETHLHPRWQRTVLGSLRKAVEGWRPDNPPSVQFLVATHSPLVLASVEPWFDEAQDALWKLDFDPDAGEVVIERDTWRLRGDASRWLKSDVFDLGEAMSREAEEAILEAGALLKAQEPDAAAVRDLDRQIQRLFSSFDPFFLRWRHFVGGLLKGEE